MKKIIFITIAAIILIIGGLIGYDELTKRSVTIELQSGDYSVAIYSGDNKVTTITQSSTVRLHDGSYAYAVIGDHYANTKLPFDITKDTTKVTVVAPYSDQYLTDLLQNEQDAIKTVVNQTYTINQGYATAIQLRERGDWAIVALKPAPANGQLSDTYYTVVHKEGDAWKIIALPQLTINKEKYPSIPASVLYNMYSVTVQN